MTDANSRNIMPRYDIAPGHMARQVSCHEMMPCHDITLPDGMTSGRDMAACHDVISVIAHHVLAPCRDIVSCHDATVNITSQIDTTS